MIRTTILLLLSISMVGCGGKNKADNGPSTSAKSNGEVQKPKADSSQRKHELQIAYIAPDGTREIFPMKGHEPGSLKVTLREGTPEEFWCKLTFVVQEGEGDFFEFDRQTSSTGSFGKKVGYHGEAKSIAKGEFGEFFLEPFGPDAD